MRRRGERERTTVEHKKIGLMADEKYKPISDQRHGTDDTDVSASPRPGVPPSPRLRVSAFPRPGVSPSPRPRVFVLLFTCLLLTVSCRQDMQDQPRMKPLRSTTFFRDGMSSRPPVPGTVPRGYLRADREFFTGKKSTAGTVAPAAAPTAIVTGTNAAPGVVSYPDDVEEFPLPITADVVTRGRERYDIFCSACHGLTGNGDGMIVRRGFRRAASFHSDNLRQAPVGHYFDAITNGWGAMPSYAAQIPARDRWAIVAYIRALQLSQQNTQPQTGQTPSPASQTATPSPGGHN
ncbi:MAG: cytochrome c [Pyrinomonadaceae bacterium]|nr:cytochrome c [Pyrinomonadaceae bacterium]